MKATYDVTLYNYRKNVIVSATVDLDTTFDGPLYTAAEWAKRDLAIAVYDLLFTYIEACFAIVRDQSGEVVHWACGSAQCRTVS